MKYLIILTIKFYQKYISIFLKRKCRFYPSCSQYAIEAFKKYKFCYALLIIIKRLLKCHPFNPGGYDPI